MIKQITSRFSLTQAQQDHIDSVPGNDRADEWDRNTVIVANIKKSIGTQLDTIQNQKCCYCGLQLWETSRGEIDHIAPKSARKKSYPHFAFTTENLALSCEFCNGSSKKGETNTIIRESVNYSQCEFKIVHPYYDNPNAHFDFIRNSSQIIIRHKTWKGKYSIILFGLKHLANARAKQTIYERKIARIRARKSIYNKFLAIIQFKRVV